MTRQAALMKKAAEAFADQRSPFCDEWLVENGVTADECFDLSVGIAESLRLASFVTANAGEPLIKKVLADWLLFTAREDGVL